jgi:hypothetical protein
VDLGHFGRIGYELYPGTTPENDGRDHEAGSSGIIVEPTKNAVGNQPKAYLFLQLTQGRRLERLARIDTPAGNRPLSAVILESRSATREDEAGCSRGVVDQGNGHCGRLPTVERARLAWVTSKVLHDACTELLGERTHARSGEWIMLPPCAGPLPPIKHAGAR